MDTKIYLSQLAKTLAEKKNLSQKDAEAFLKEFFDSIIRNVTSDKSVKIKGLGIFKLIEVLERESVDVSTGERIVIPGHTKLSFTPDASLKDIVNKPFVDFQTVIINEGTSLEEMEMIPQTTLDDQGENQPVLEEEQPPLPPIEEETEKDTLSEAEPEIDSEPELEAEPEHEPEVEHEPEPVPAPEVETEPVKEPESEPQAESEPVKAYEPATKSKPEPVPLASAKVRALTTAEKWAMTLGIILLCVLSYFMGYYHVFDSLTTVPQKKEIKKVVPAPKKAPAKTPVVKKDTIPPALLEEKAEESNPPQKEVPRPRLDASKRYQITGTRGTHIMKPGDYLTKIALQEYGDKEFARYIIAHNKFRDPDNVPVGKEIMLPELEEVK